MSVFFIIFFNSFYSKSPPAGQSVILPAPLHYSAWREIVDEFRDKYSFDCDPSSDFPIYPPAAALGHSLDTWTETRFCECLL